MKRFVLMICLVLVTVQGWCVGSSTLDLGNAVIQRSFVVASLSADFVLAGLENKELPWASEEIDTLNELNGATFTARISGYYRVWVRALTFGANTSVVCFVNNATQENYSQVVTAGQILIYSNVIKVAAGQTLTTHVYSDAGGTFGKGNTLLTIERAYPN